MKTKIFMAMLLLASVCLSSCDKDRISYPKMKKEQKKAIEQFISSQGIEVLRKYPANGVFGEKQFYLTDEGVYIHVVDSGNGQRAQFRKTEVLMRFSGRNFFKKDTTSFNFFDNKSVPFEFTYGRADMVLHQHKTDRKSAYYYYFSTSLEVALRYVGDRSTVRMIIPFEVGSEDQLNRGIPLYYEKITFRFY
ncbi:DUF4827 domain-containing protein [Tannerella forsythia]|uniref:DUF4827 family protein n=1 Tax=Tannerella forsythia TaxID=28112 RepID=A0A3P1XK66_TANFO|nr:DUF4827 domain-containing protein [Tannerella forsythia]RRD58370.1 DUF4827 family protein [Tannerella forsythia]